MSHDTSQWNSAIGVLSGGNFFMERQFTFTCPQSTVLHVWIIFFNTNCQSSWFVISELYGDKVYIKLLVTVWVWMCSYLLWGNPSHPQGQISHSVTSHQPPWGCVYIITTAHWYDRRWGQRLTWLSWKGWMSVLAQCWKGLLECLSVADPTGKYSIAGKVTWEKTFIFRR